MTMTNAEEVILLDDEGRTIGLAPKAGLHEGYTTRPGVWTDSLCAHPQTLTGGTDVSSADEWKRSA